MLTHARRTQAKSDAGFTLIELLVVMIIIGILAAIAIPVFTSQRAKARDTATKADVSTVGKEVASYYVDGTGPLALSLTGNVLRVTANAGATTVAQINLSAGTALGTKPWGATAGQEATSWCVGLTNPEGSIKNYSYTYSSGLQARACP